MESLSLNILLFVILSLLIGVATRYLFKNTKVPYTVALLIMGVVLGLFSTANNFESM